MSEPSLQIQKAVRDALFADTGIDGLVGNNIFDRVPTANPFPRITIGDDEVDDDGDSCGEGWQAFVNVHVWSRAVGFPEAKAIASAVHTVLADGEALSVAGYRVVTAQHVRTIPLRDPDGLTSHIVVTFEYLIDTA